MFIYLSSFREHCKIDWYFYNREDFTRSTKKEEIGKIRRKYTGKKKNRNGKIQIWNSGIPL